jgi:hypothetical protein
MSFFDQGKQRDIYKLLGIDHSIEEINKRIYYEDNKDLYYIKPTNKEKQIGLALRGNARISKFTEVNKKNKKKVEKKIPKTLGSSDFLSEFSKEHIRKKMNQN